MTPRTMHSWSETWELLLHGHLQCTPKRQQFVGGPCREFCHERSTRTRCDISGFVASPILEALRHIYLVPARNSCMYNSDSTQLC